MYLSASKRRFTKFFSQIPDFILWCFVPTTKLSIARHEERRGGNNRKEGKAFRKRDFKLRLTQYTRGYYGSGVLDFFSEFPSPLHPFWMPLRFPFQRTVASHEKSGRLSDTGSTAGLAQVKMHLNGKCSRYHRPYRLPRIQCHGWNVKTYADVYVGNFI